MRRLTLRLPETLFHHLELLADSEGVSLNQYLVYSLARSVARSYRTIPVAKEQIEHQQAQLDKLIAALGVASTEAFDAILAEGEFDERGVGVNADVVARVEAQLETA